MKISAINNNINFKGLYTDKSMQNGGDWRMEYSPYSWECSYWTGYSAKENPRDIDIFGTVLSDNEMISEFNDGRRSYKDILGTEFSYEYNDGRMRKAITEVPAMNREDSLTVFNKKMKKFLALKSEKLASITKTILDIGNGRYEMNHQFEQHANDIKKWSINRNYSLECSSDFMSKEYDNVLQKIGDIVRQFEQYKTIRDSMDYTKKYIAENDKEIELLSERRNAGKLIDISRRNIYDPNKKLWDAMHNVKKVADKFVVLPHKMISVDEILKYISKYYKNMEIPDAAIRYVDMVINSRM